MQSLDNPKLEGQSGMKKDLKLTQSVKGSDQFNKKS